jgi:opacity protein-like surface antigen
MKKYLLAIAMAVLAVTNVFADNDNDDDKYPGGWDFELPGLKVSKASTSSKATVKGSISSTFSFGFIGGVSQDPGVGINMGQSFEIEWGDVISTKLRLGRKDFLRLGMGFDWRNYRMTDRMFVKGTDGIAVTSPFPAGTEPKFSRIHTFSLSFPLKYYHYFNKKMYFAIGPELYITPWASLKTKYYENGEEQKITAGNIHENTVSLGVGAEINIHHIGIYYKYNPFNVLSSSFGPGFASMTTGIKIAF